jgi:hypothetical protein
MYIQNYTWFVPLSYLSPIYISYIYLSVYLSTYLAIYLSICLSTVSIYLPSYLSVYLFIHRSIHPASYLSNLSLSLNLVQPNSIYSWRFICATYFDFDIATDRTDPQDTDPGDKDGPPLPPGRLEHDSHLRRMERRDAPESECWLKMVFANVYHLVMTNMAMESHS